MSWIISYRMRDVLDRHILGSNPRSVIDPLCSSLLAGGRLARPRAIQATWCGASTGERGGSGGNGRVNGPTTRQSQVGKRHREEGHERLSCMAWVALGVLV